MALYNPKKTFTLKISYFAFLLTGVALTILSSPADLSGALSYILGKILGVLGLSCLTLQLLLGARFKLLEKGVGLDRILHWHSLNARLIFIFIFFHPILIFAPTLNKVSFIDIIISLNFFHWLGITAFLLIILTIILTVYQSKIKLNYEYWKVIHKVGYLIIILGFVHSFFVGSDIIARKPLFYWWIILAILAFYSVVYRYIIRNWLLRDSWYRIVKIVKESRDVRSIYFKPMKNKIFLYFPGQFAFVRFYSKGLSREEHHFTISSSPLHNPISFTVKESGDFTSELYKLKVGDKAKIEGPFGTFSNLGLRGPFVFIAGGIGITPIMSMLRFMRDTNQKEKTLLIYSVKSKRELVFYKELEKLKKSRWLKVIYVLSGGNYESKSGFYHGRVNSQLLRTNISNLKSSIYFLVGPPQMINSTKKILITLGIRKEMIATEVFALK